MFEEINEEIEAKGLDFAVVFIEGIPIVIGPKGNLITGVPLSDTETLDNINKLECLLVGHWPNRSPCCIVWGGMKYCWCPE